MKETELLKKLGEETLYSAKGHFKACDIRRNLITITLWLCALTGVLDLASILPDDRIFDIIGVMGTIALLIWNEGEGKNYRNTHKEVAEKYLALHKEVRACFFMNEFDRNCIEELSKKVSLFDQSDKPDIPGYARRWARRAIEKGGETDNWFLNN
jgi:hypothetical protein